MNDAFIAVLGAIVLVVFWDWIKFAGAVVVFAFVVSYINRSVDEAHAASKAAQPAVYCGWRTDAERLAAAERCNTLSL